LLAEYDGNGACVREYIYLGAKMIAEYSSGENDYYDWTKDQINLNGKSRRKKPIKLDSSCPVG